MNPPVPGTVVIYGPFFARSGFGILARGWAMALHQAGIPVRAVPVDCSDPKSSGDLDDCDLHLLQSLKFTPLRGPVTAIFAYVPTYAWPKIQLPQPHRRILLTTFDSSANAATPPARIIFIANQMDQVWLANRTEEQAWIRGGVEPTKVRSFNWPHEWIDNPQLGAPAKRVRADGEPYRFLHISLFLPRRRLDVLIRAFFEEFRQATEAELHLKISYPTWHPVPGKPKKDLANLVERLRRETGSKAGLVIDETLGTRRDLARLIDRCDAYVSPDTTHTAPVTEAILRHLPIIITDGWGVDLPPQAIVIPNSQERIALTPEMAEYMPHQRGSSFPALDKGLMRQALRRVFSLNAEERRELVEGAMQYMRERYSYAATAPAAIQAINEAWNQSTRIEEVSPSKGAEKREAAKLNINWSGLQLFYGKLPTANREICLELLRRGHHLSLAPANGIFHIEEFDLATSPKYTELARHFHNPISSAPNFSIVNRWHPVFNEHPQSRQILANSWWHGATPVDWRRPISESTDEVWVPSRFVRQNFIDGGIAPEQLHVIPAGIDPALFRPGNAPFPLKTRKRIKFLFVGEATQRKGFDLLLQSFIRTFNRRDDVCLVVKDMNCDDYYVKQGGRALVEKCQADSRCPEIEYISAMLTEEELAGLYAACDCFVQPHRASSFGLAVLEALACGLPVITTDFGGVREFCDETNSFLVPAREIRQRRNLVGHWKVNGEQVHAEIEQAALQERMEYVFKHSAVARERAILASEKVREAFCWSRIVDQVEARFKAISTMVPRRTRASAPSTHPTQTMKTDANGPTAILFAPFYNRSGYGVAARALAMALDRAGMKIRIVPVDNVEDGIDDCDMNWLRSLEKTPVTTPVVAVFFHVPHANWLKIKLPDPCLRVMFTTFDSSAQGNLPPAEWISVINQLDQLWLMTVKESEAFATAGVSKDKIHVVDPAHPWIHNPVLPLPQAAPVPLNGRKFRFLCISMFLPRRRWDTLIEAFLAEFKDTPDAAELYLKVNYPSWHPVPGQPQRDLRELIETLRKKTGSRAAIVLDEDLGTRLDICRIIDSCDAYVSTDTSTTAPLGEAFVRGKIAVIPDGYGVALPSHESACIIPVDPKLSQPMTEAMLAYQPHHRGKQMPLLRVDDVRKALRSAFELPPEERASMGRHAMLAMEATYGPSVVITGYLKAIREGLARLAPTRSQSESAAVCAKLKVTWEGSFLDFGSLSHVNRAMTDQLEKHPEIQLHRVNAGQAAGDALPAYRVKLSSTTADAQVTVRHAWPPNWSKPSTGKLAVIQPWEFGALPTEWVKQASNVDEFWVPSRMVQKFYTDSGIDAAKVHVVPNGIDPDVFRSDANPRQLATNKKFRFLFVGGTIGRKGPDVLLNAYLKSFTAKDDVCLVIKDFGGNSVYRGQTFAEQIKQAQQLPNAPEILYLDQELSPEELPGLYTACQCLVHPYRGEGFGLPVLEAMACGLPVVVTGGGATDDFATDEFAYRIPSTRRNIGSEVGGMKTVSEAWLLEPDINALARRLKWIVANPSTARDKGAAASQHVCHNWTWQRAAGIASKRLEVLANAVVPKPAAAPAKTINGPLPAVAHAGSLTKAREHFGRKALAEAWTATTDAIGKRPFHPEGFLLLAEIAFAGGDANSARTCAQRARDLAPGWNAPRQFLQKPLKGNAKPEWLALPVSIANRQSPIGNVSVCVITKNEEKFIAQCLKSVQGLASQIVVVDTGSTDRTVEIAKAHGAEIHTFTWCDDFAAARNAALEHATGDWILMLDADEELPADQHANLRKDMARADVLAHRLPLVNEGQNDGRSFVPRLFRNVPGTHFYGRIHEQVFPSLVPHCKPWGMKTDLGTAQLLHHGYSKEMVKDRNKVERNLRLLKQAITERPDDVNLVLNLGLELVRSGELQAGLARYQQAFEMMSSQPAHEVVPELREVLLTQYSVHLYRNRQHIDVIRILNSPLAQKGGLTASLHFALGLADFEMKNHRAAAEQMRQCLAKRNQPALSPINTDILTCATNHCLGLSLMQMGDPAGAEKAFLAALTETGNVENVKLDYARLLVQQNRHVDALHKLHEIVAVNPQNVNAWKLGADVALAKPEFLEFACDWTSEAIKALPEERAIIAQRAEALLLSQQTKDAHPLWERACNCARPPQALAALILCSAVESQPIPSTRDTAEEAATSRAFVGWYQRLVNAGAEETIVRLNSRVGDLRQSLPTAANLLDSALAAAKALS